MEGEDTALISSEEDVTEISDEISVEIFLVQPKCQPVTVSKNLFPEMGNSIFKIQEDGGNQQSISGWSKVNGESLTYQKYCCQFFN